MWLVGFLSLLIPLLILLHILLLVLNIRKMKSPFFIHLAAIIIGFAFIKVSYSISRNDDGEGLKVLSYNVRVFNNYAHLRNEQYISSRKMISWSVDNDAQIKCFQEYYNNDRSGIFNVRTRLADAGWKHNHCKILVRDRARSEFGIAIFSKLPIVGTGEIRSDNDEFLNSIYADIVFGADTVRIYNIHLESMSIDEENVVNTERLAQSYKDTGYRLRNGFISRSRQVKGLIADINSCKHKVILCGDLNELPYSYPYFSLRRLLNNAFEKAGNGFGFTYNGKLFFLRIDNQFFSRDINIRNFMIHRNIDFSDHFPLTATYTW
jgi:endonuclease/exonuclease/phosphatase family metal-dependent hydrolase